MKYEVTALGDPTTVLKGPMRSPLLLYNSTVIAVVVIVEKMLVVYFAVICVSLLLNEGVALTTKKVRVNYPTELLHPKIGSIFAANVTQDKLVCFGNEDYNAPTYRETLFCMLPYLPGTSSYCYSVWGSRAVEVEVTGSIEFLKVAKLPHETTSTKNISPHKEFLLDNAYSLEISTTRWLEMQSIDRRTSVKKTIQIPAEPIYLCARSTDWQSRSTTFSMKFRPAYLRVKDKRLSHTQTLVHIFLIVAVSFVWFVPYFAALVAAVLVYEHGIKIMLTLFLFSTCLVCLTPLMFTKHNRQSARAYFNYFFTRFQAAQMRQHIIKRLPVFQALFFSSLLIFCGFGAVYGAYYYDFMEREFRNSCLKTILSVAISWFVFSLCRSFERFFTSWLWILMSMTLAHILDPHLNPTCRTEVVVATMIISQVVRLIVPHVVQFQFINAIISSALPRLEGVSSKLRIPLPYQIYEHHSLRHLIYIHADSANSLHTITHTTTGTSNSPLLNLTHTSTSTADLDHLYHNNSRQSTSRRSSFASIHEIQPLVDYLDDVLEGREHGQGYGELGLLTELGEIMENEEEDGGDLEGEFSDRNRSAGELLYLMGETENADSAAQSTNNMVGSVNATSNCSYTKDTRGSAGREGVPLYERLQEQGASQEPVTESTGPVEERNRAALLHCANISVEDIPMYTLSTSSSVRSDTLVASSIQTDTERDGAPAAAAEAAVKTTSGRVTRSGKVKTTNSGTSATTDTSDAAVTRTDLSDTTKVVTTNRGTDKESVVLFPQLIGATVVPLSLVGPVYIANTSPDSSTGNNSNKSGSDVATGGTSSRHWYPLATQDTAVVNSVEAVCSSVLNSVECTVLPPLQDTLSFTCTLRTSKLDNIYTPERKAWLQWPVPYLPHLLRSAIQGDPTACFLVSTLRARHTVHDMFQIKCVHQGNSAVLQLSVSTTVVCSVLTMVTVGKALMKRILKAIQADYVHLQSDAVLVNYASLTTLTTLSPFMHYTSVVLTLSPPASVTLESLLKAHRCVDLYEANVRIKDTLRALCTAINVDMKCIDGCDEWVKVVEFTSDGSNLVVSGSVPVILTQIELRLSGHDDNVGGANKCRALLTGANDDASACEHAVSTLVLCTYMAFLQNAE